MSYFIAVISKLIFMLKLFFGRYGEFNCSGKLSQCCFHYQNILKQTAVARYKTEG